MFKEFGYEVINLDRVNFDILSHQDLKIGEYRELTDTEISHLLQFLK